MFIQIIMDIKEENWPVIFAEIVTMDGQGMHILMKHTKLKAIIRVRADLYLIKPWVRATSGPFIMHYEG